MLPRRQTIHPVCHAPPLALPGFDHINRYWDRHHNTFSAKILPGQYYVTRNDESIVTVLGSCVAACIRDVSAKIGGMNHFMLPAHGVNGHHSIDLSDAARYGTYAMELLINDILKNGGSRRSLEIKIFGGGNIIKNMTDIGKRNIEFVRHFIETEGLEIAAADVGSIYPRKVYYFPATGRALIKRLRTQHNNTIVERERHYMDDLDRKPVSGEVDLF